MNPRWSLASAGWPSHCMHLGGSKTVFHALEAERQSYSCFHKFSKDYDCRCMEKYSTCVFYARADQMHMGETILHCGITRAWPTLEREVKWFQPHRQGRYSKLLHLVSDGVVYNELCNCMIAAAGLQRNKRSNGFNFTGREGIQMNCSGCCCNLFLLDGAQ